MSDRPVLKLVSPPGSGAVIRNDQGSGAGANRDFIVFKKSGTETFSVDKNGLPDPGGGDATRSVQIAVGDIVADSDAVQPFLVKFNSAVVITAIKLAVNAATATGVTNRQTIAVKRSSDDGQVVSFQTAAANPGLAQAVWTSMGAVTNSAIAAGEYLYCAFTKTSSGLALAGLTLQIEYTLAG